MQIKAKISRVPDIALIEITTGQTNYIINGIHCSVDPPNLNISSGVIQVYDKYVSIEDDISIPFPQADEEYAVTLLFTYDRFGFANASIEFFKTSKPIIYAPSDYIILTFLTVSNNNATINDVSATGLSVDRLGLLSPSQPGNMPGTCAISVTGPDFTLSGTLGSDITNARLATTGVVPGTYNNSTTAITPFTVDAKGRITATGTPVTITPAWSSITSKPTTLAGYGITDAASVNSPTFTGTVTIPTLTVTGNATVSGNETVSGSFTTIGNTLLGDKTSSFVKTFHNVLDDGNGNVTITGNLTVSGSSTVINSTVTDEDHLLLSPAAASTIALQINPQTTLTSNAIEVSVSNNGPSVFTVGANGTTTITTLTSTGNTLLGNSSNATVKTYHNTLDDGTGNTSISGNLNVTGTITGNLNGNATTASALKNSITIATSGDATGSTSFNGSANVTIPLTLSPTGVTTGTYNNNATSVTPFTIDAKGRITATGTPITITPSWSSITNKPTTLAGYGITDAAPINSPTFTGTVTIPTLSVTGNATVSGNETVSGSFTSIGNTLLGDQASSTVKTFHNVLDDGKGNVTITGNLTVSGSSTIINSAVTDEDHLLLSPASASTIALEINPQTTLTSNAVQVAVTNDGPSVFTIGADGTTTISSLTTTGNTLLGDTSGSTVKTYNNTLDDGNGNSSITGNLSVTGTISGSLSGNATTASALKNSVTISTSGDATGSVSFNGSTNVTIPLTLATTGVTAGIYGSSANIPQITIDGKGRITSANNIAISIPSGSINVTGTDITMSGTTGSDITNATLTNTGVTAGTYNNSTTAITPFTIDAKGRITSTGTPVTITPDWSSITNTPTTLEGYGITDAAPINNPTFTGTVTIPTLSVTGDETVSGSFTTIGNTLLGDQAGSTVKTFHNVLDDGKGNVTITGNLTVSGSSTVINSTVTDEDHLLLSPAAASTIALQINPQTTLTSNAIEVAVTNNGPSVFTIGADGTTTISSLTTTSNTLLGNSSSATVKTYHNTLDDGNGNSSIAGNLSVTGTITGSLSGNATTASQLQNSVTISTSGDATGSASFNGSANVTIPLTLATTGVTAGTYGGSANIPQITIDDKGRITSATNVAVSTLSGGSGSINVTGTDITMSGTTGTDITNATLTDTGVTAGTYNNSATQVTPFTVDAKGRITATGTPVTITPAWSSITNTPTTLAGYGITDAAPINNPTFTGTVTIPTLSVTGNATVSGNETVSGSFTSIGNTLLGDKTGSTVKTFHNVLDDGSGNVTITGNLTVSGSSTVINSTVTDEDHLLLSPASASTIALQINPQTTLTSNAIQVAVTNNGPSVFTVGANGTTTITTLTSTGNTLLGNSSNATVKTYHNTLDDGTGNVSINANETISGTLTVPTANINTLNLSGNLNGSFAITPAYCNWQTYGTGAGGASIYNDNNNYKCLMITGNTSNGGSSRQVGIWDYLTVNGGQTITGALTVNGGITTNNSNINAGTGTITAGTINATNVTFSGTTVSSLTVNGNGTISGTLSAGVTTLNSLTVTNNSSLNTVSANSITSGQFTGALNIPDFQYLQFGITNDNTDTIYFQRNNVANDLSILQLVIGDSGTGSLITQPSSGTIDYFSINAQDGIHHLWGTDGTYIAGGTISSLTGISAPSISGTTLTLSSNATISGTLSAGSTTVSSLTDTGNATINGSLSAGSTTLSGLTVNGNGSVSGTLSAGATTLSSLSVTGNETISGSLTVGNGISGTILTASQPNITSLGTLIGLSISGNETISGSLTVNGIVYANSGISVGNNVGTVNFVSNSDGTSGGYIEWFPASGMPNQLNITGDSGSALSTFYVNATTINLNGNLITNNATFTGITTNGLTVNGNETISGTLSAGTTTLSSLSVTGNETISGSLTVNGGTNLQNLTLLSFSAPQSIPVYNTNISNAPIGVQTELHLGFNKYGATSLPLVAQGNYNYLNFAKYKYNVTSTLSDGSTLDPTSGFDGSLTSGITVPTSKLPYTLTITTKDGSAIDTTDVIYFAILAWGGNGGYPDAGGTLTSWTLEIYDLNSNSWLTVVNRSGVNDTFPIYTPVYTSTASDFNANTPYVSFSGIRLTVKGATSPSWSSGNVVLTEVQLVTTRGVQPWNAVSALSQGGGTIYGGLNVLDNVTLQNSLTTTGNTLLGNSSSATVKTYHNTIDDGSGNASISGNLTVTGTITGNLNGNASTASALKNSITISTSGDATGSASFNGSANVTIPLTLANSGVTAGTYNNSATQVTPFTVDAKGRITATKTAVTITPAWSSITNKPTTLSGYGITDGAPINNPTFTGTVTVPTLVVQQAIERANIVNSAASGTITFNVLSGDILYYTSAATGNWTLNITGNSSTTLNSLLSVGQVVSVVFLNTNGSTAYYQSGLQIDGSAVTPKWLNSSPVTRGNANAIDIYTITIIKTASSTYTIVETLASFG